MQVKLNPTPTNDEASLNRTNDSEASASTNSDADRNENISQGKPILWKRLALFFCVAAVGLLADLVTKSLTFKYYFDPNLRFQPPHYWVDGIFGIQTSTNPGALFGMGSGYSWLFAILSVIALAAVLLWLIAFGAARDRWLTFTLGLISGGILGNLYDRLGWGATPGFPEEIRTNVRDWILFRLEGVPFFDPWPNFNFADCWLVCGAAMLMFHTFFLLPPEDDEGR